MFVFVLCFLCGCVECSNGEVGKKYEMGGDEHDKTGGECGQASNMMFVKQEKVDNSTQSMFEMK